VFFNKWLFLNTLKLKSEKWFKDKSFTLSNIVIPFISNNLLYSNSFKIKKV